MAPKNFFRSLATALFAAFSLLAALRLQLSDADEAPVPNFAFSWLDDRDAFEAGDLATVKIKVLGNFVDDGNKTAFNPTLTINGKTGNSSYISGVSSRYGNDTDNWRIFFIPIVTGVFNLIVADARFGVLDSTLHFTVSPGKFYPSASVASWKGLVNGFVAGMKATVLILPKDAFGNNISTNSQEPNPSVFKLSALYDNGSIADIRNVTYLGWNKVGYVGIDFMASAAGNFSLHLEGGNQTLDGSPLPFKVTPGPLDVSGCSASWNFGPNAFQIFSKMEIFIHQYDQYGNLVPGLHEFDAEVVEKGANLSVPVADLFFKEVLPGIQLFSFSLSEPGNFMLTIHDMKQNKSISNMPYEYTVFVGYCDGSSSIINGSGLNGSTAGETAKFSVYLKDSYQYPAPVELEKLQVQIVRKVDSLPVSKSIHPMQLVNGSGSGGEVSFDIFNNMKIAPAPSVDSKNTSFGSPKIQSSDFDIIYTPEKSGVYDIFVYCGNIPLNGGLPFTKEVRPGNVNVSLSAVVGFDPKVPKLIKNEVKVLLVDSFNNSVSSQQSKLKLEMASINSSSVLTWPFMDTKDGSYSGQYMAKEVGTYEMCASFDGKRFTPCPLGINVYSSDYFPKAEDDIVSVWEDQSISFDLLENDYFASGNASIVEFSIPGHGSLLQYGRLFRYTPYKNFYGNDNFSYTISDVNGNLATGSVDIFVLITPPQFVSIPSQLEAIEDVLSPISGGFSGFEISYSDLVENISVVFSAQSGAVFLFPMLMQLWQPIWNALSVKKGYHGDDLILEGPVEVLNFAIQSIQYFGNENFFGNDIIQISTNNRNGMNAMNVSVFVEPVNDPPFIHAPEYIILKKSNGNGSRIFDRERDKFEFSVGDPDLINFPGGESRFVVTFSLEVDFGILMANLPAELIDTTEVKLKNGYQWRPLQTFVTISKHFMVQAQGVRVRGTVKHCNSIMQELFFDGGELGAVLTVRVNDMGYYGRYPGSSENNSLPLFAEANINLIRRGHMSSIVAHGLGSAIIIEFVLVFSLGIILLFFACKCALVLVNERRSCHDGNTKPSRVHSCINQPSNTGLHEKATRFTRWCSSLFLSSIQHFNFCQRSLNESGDGETGEDAYHASQSSSDHGLQTSLRSLTPLAIEKGKKETP